MEPEGAVLRKKTTDRRHFEKEDQDLYESMKRPGDGQPMYACIRAYPIARMIVPGRVVTKRSDFFGVADMVCFRTDQPGVIFAQSTSGDTENPHDMVNEWKTYRKYPGDVEHNSADRCSGPVPFFIFFILFFFPQSANFYTDFLPIGRPDIYDNSGRQGLI